MFSKSNTNRSMTVKIKTMKTSDLDLDNDTANDFLKSMNGDTDSGGEIKRARSKITK